MVAAKTARKTVLRQAIADMSYHWCPVTANIPTRMTAAGFKVACEGFQEKAAMRHGIAKFQAKKYETCRICKGETIPIGLEIIQLKEFKPDEVDKVATKKNNGTCEVCGRENMTVGRNNGVICCSGCMGLQAAIKKMPDKVVAELQRLQGTGYFPVLEPDDVPRDEWLFKTVSEIREVLGVERGVHVDDLALLIKDRLNGVPVDPDHDEQWARGVIRSVRHALGIEDGEPVEDLAARVELLVREKKAALGTDGTYAEQQQRLDRFQTEIDTLTSANNDLAAQNMELQEEADRIEKSYVALETNFGTMARKMKDLLADNAEQADIIKHLTSEKGEEVELVACEVDMVPVARLLSDNTLLAAVNTLAGELRGAA